MFTMYLSPILGVGTLIGLVSSLVLKHVDLYYNPSLEFALMLCFVYIPCKYIIARTNHACWLSANFVLQMHLLKVFICRELWPFCLLESLCPNSKIKNENVALSTLFNKSIYLISVPITICLQSLRLLCNKQCVRWLLHANPAFLLI